MPNEKVELQSADSSITLGSIVRQDKTYFNAEDLEAFDEVETTGTIEPVARADGGDINEISGSYTGTMIFNISIVDKSTPEVVKYGLFKNRE